MKVLVVDTAPRAKTWRQTMDLRWGLDPRMYIVDGNNIGPQRELQQAWHCLETGEIEWKPIPTA